MKTITITANHGRGEFSQTGVKVGKLFVHSVVVADDDDDGSHYEYRIAHAKSLYLLPGFYADEETAIAAARRINKITDWDTDAPNLTPVDGQSRGDANTKALGMAVCRIAQAHGADGLPRHLWPRPLSRFLKLSATLERGKCDD